MSSMMHLMKWVESLSFALDNARSIIIPDGSSMQCTAGGAVTLYVKEIVKGESYVELAEEEAEALDKAIFEDGYEEEVNKAVASVTGSMKMAKSGPAKNGNQKNSNARSAKQASGKANNGKILNTRTSSMRPDMARPEKNKKMRDNITYI